MAHPSSSKSRPPPPPPRPPPPPPPPTSQSGIPGGDSSTQPSSSNPPPTSQTGRPAGDSSTVQRRAGRRSESDIESGLAVTSDTSPPPRESFSTASVRNPPPATITSSLSTFRSGFFSIGGPASRPHDHHHREDPILPITRQEIVPNRGGPSIRSRISTYFARCNWLPQGCPSINMIFKCFASCNCFSQGCSSIRSGISTCFARCNCLPQGGPSIRSRLFSCFTGCNCLPHADPPISSRLLAYFLGRKCYWVVLFFVYYILGVTVFWIVQAKSMSSSKGLAFGGGSNNTFIDANYFTVVTLTSIGFGDVYPAREDMQLFISFYIFFGILLMGVVSVIISRSLEDFEDWVLDKYVAGCTPWVLQRRPVGQGRGRWLGVKVVCTFVLSFAAMLIISIHGGFYLVLTSVTTVGYGNVAFQTPEDRLFAAKWLFFGVLLYGRLVSLMGEYFGSPNAQGA